MTDTIHDIALAILQRAPEWVRHDFVSKDPAARSRAEETLAAMVANAVQVDAPADE